MNRVAVTSLEQLSQQLQEGEGWANGKNFPVDHLHATVAESRWPYENIHGIYVTNAAHTWMALWMAVCNREALRKRHLRYLAPQASDVVGKLEIFSSTDVAACLVPRGYLYLFGSKQYLERGEVVDISEVPKAEKVAALTDHGFRWRKIMRHNQLQRALVDTTPGPRTVLVDDWQVALTNVPQIIPDHEIVIEPLVVQALLGRVALSASEIGEDYIVR